MKSLATPRILLMAALVTASPVAAQTLTYQGNHTAGTTCSSKSSSVAPGVNLGCVMYDNITVGGDGWNVTGLFGNFYQADVEGMAPWTSAFWEIRTGMGEGNAGTLVYGGASAIASATHVATGRSFTTSSATFDEYLATIALPEFFLAPGTYWLGIAPVVIETAAVHLGAYASWTGTSASGGINSQADNVGISWINGSNNYVVQSHDFSYGVLGTLAQSGGPGNGNPGENPGVPVSEPPAMTLLAAGLMAIVGMRRRKR
ncbi:MAG: hypothetical protein IBJ03_18335 [Gemmatimonadaceae bacterium]|nr:hypothetical protein [Gemmatimonadaceae bacterium]